MKKQSENLFETVNKEQVEYLTSQVNETLATDFDHIVNKVFTATDLWNIQRQGKSCTQRRHAF